MAVREMVNIDEAKCNGCGDCVPSCDEGAIQIINGKAKLLSDSLCDGLGACLGDCPQGAITIGKREADAYDEEAVTHHLKELCRAPAPHHVTAAVAPAMAGGCPSTRVQSFGGCPSAQVKAVAPASSEISDVSGQRSSELRQWPVQLHLIPATAPFLQGANLLIAADCVPFAYADFHKDMLKEKALVIACPKLDDGQAYIEKLSQMFAQGGIKSLSVAIMEVPCCSGLVAIVRQALTKSGADIPLKVVTISIKGEFK
ncbi:ATP-binding protein [Geopsychrobacter electrodiphilus]|uniref:ATP-binding protein n=1 Tax=Geopsychrobacter electrodiphilus TaxID=225196 RepID=UPI000374ED72|nr:4Fe-4S dicluster domain-containing protein [Geopsychrobacter electrodiphilus]